MTALRPGTRVHFVSPDGPDPHDRGTVWADIATDGTPVLVVTWDHGHDDAPDLDQIDADGGIVGLPGCRVELAPHLPLTGEPL